MRHDTHDDGRPEVLLLYAALGMALSLALILAWLFLSS